MCYSDAVRGRPPDPPAPAPATPQNLRVLKSNDAIPLAAAAVTSDQQKPDQKATPASASVKDVPWFQAQLGRIAKIDAADKGSSPSDLKARRAGLIGQYNQAAAGQPELLKREKLPLKINDSMKFAEYIKYAPKPPATFKDKALRQASAASVSK